MLGLNTDKECIQNVELDPATPEEISDTIKVMGGEDWCRWVNKLRDEDLLADAFKTTAFTYIGEKITWDLYWDGCVVIKKARMATMHRHVERTENKPNKKHLW